MIHQCLKCDSAFPSKNKLFLHIREVHTDLCHSKRVLDSNHELKIDIIEDHEVFRVIVKPQGLATMGIKGLTLLNSGEMLLQDALEKNLSYKKAIPCHRLDMKTGGLVICSKTKLSESSIKLCFRLKLVKKKYLAVVSGKMATSEGTIETLISGKLSKTLYRVLKISRSLQFGWVTTVELFPLTGRKHQLRKHMLSLGHPIIGDRKHASALSWPKETDRMFLWAVRVEFPHPSKVAEVLADLRPEAAIDGTETDASQQGEVAKDDDDDEAEGEMGGDELLRKALERLSEEDSVVVEIPEPALYEKFRALHEEQWREARTSSAGDTSDPALL